MAKTATIKIDDKEYVIPKLKIGQLERVCEVFTDPSISTTKKPFLLLPIIMENASPTVENYDDLEPSLNEIREGVNAVLEMSNLTSDKKAPEHPLALGDGDKNPKMLES